MKSSHAVALGVAGLFAVPLAAADEFALSAGFDYSTGKYGGAEATDMLYLPVVARYESGPAILKLTVPYVEIRRPTATTTSGVVTVTEENPVIVTTAMSGGQKSRAAGLGDVVGALTYNLHYAAASGFVLDGTAKAKFATGDQSQGLSTGKDDFALQLDAFQTTGRLSLLGSAGYRWMGKPAGSSFRNVPYASVGFAYKTGDATTVGMLADYRSSVVSGMAAQRELTLYAAHRLDKHWKLQGYLVGGMSDSSPDAGGGAMLAYVF